MLREKFLPELHKWLLLQTTLEKKCFGRNFSQSFISDYYYKQLWKKKCFGRNFFQSFISDYYYKQLWTKMLREKFLPELYIWLLLQTTLNKTASGEISSRALYLTTITNNFEQNCFGRYFSQSFISDYYYKQLWKKMLREKFLPELYIWLLLQTTLNKNASGEISSRALYLTTTTNNFEQNCFGRNFSQSFISDYYYKQLWKKKCFGRNFFQSFISDYYYKQLWSKNASGEISPWASLTTTTNNFGM